MPQATQTAVASSVPLPMELAGTTAGMAKGFTLAGNDAQNRTLVLSLFSPPANGTISGSGANLTYTPRTGFTGFDSFTYRAVVSGTATASEPAVIYVYVR